jgi:hypothetical protein
LHYLTKAPKQSVKSKTSKARSTETMSQVSVKFTDDQTGSNANVEVSANGHSQSVKSLLANTSLAKDGFINAIELQANFINVTLIVKNNNQEIGKASGNADNVARFSRTSIDHLTIEVTRA